MKRLISSIAAAAALTVAGLASAQTSPSQEPAAQPYPSEQPMPSDQMTPSERQMPPPSTPDTPADPRADQSGPSPSEPATGPAPAPGAARGGSPHTRLATIVPPGMTAQEACTGFTNVSDCVTSLHAAQNLGLAFADLKARLTGGQKLDAAIHEMKPEVDAKAEVLKAQEQTRADLRPSSG
jgi:hypothetical protein